MLAAAARALRTGTSAAVGFPRQVRYRQYAAMAEFSRDYDVMLQTPSEYP